MLLGLHKPVGICRAPSGSVRLVKLHRAGGARGARRACGAS